MASSAAPKKPKREGDPMCRAITSRVVGLAACLALFPLGCATGWQHADLALTPRPEVVISLPYLEPQGSREGSADPVRPVNWNQQPELLPPPKREVPPDKGKLDNAPAPISGLTLPQAIQLCLQADPKLRAAAELVAQA